MMEKNYQTYLEKRDEALPQPILPSHENWVSLHALAWDQAAKHIRHHPGLASEFYMDEAHTPGQVWQWDTCFMAQYCHYAADLFPGVESLDNFYSWQDDSGFISMCNFLDTGKPVYGERINPQLFAWVEFDYYRLTGDSSRLERILPTLIRYYQWVKQNRRRGEIISPHSGDTNKGLTGEGGLYWATCSGAMGVDNSPRCQHLGWNGGEICWIDTTTYQALSAQYIAKIAAVVGREDESQAFTQEYEMLKQLINRHMWNERNQFYYDIFMDGNFTATKTVVSFLPMLAAIPAQAQADGLLSHLRNPREFWRPHPIPSLSWDDPNYEATGGYWIGGVWSPTNYMVARGLTQYGFDTTAHEIASRHLDGMCRVLAEFEPATIWEAYAPEDTAIPATTKDRKSWCKPDFCGWSALGAINMLYENVIGISQDSPKRSIHWDLFLDERHGIHNYPFAGTRIDLTHTPEQTGKPVVTIQSPIPFSLTLAKGKEQAVHSIPAGKTEIRLS